MLESTSEEAALKGAVGGSGGACSGCQSTQIVLPKTIRRNSHWDHLEFHQNSGNGHATKNIMFVYLFCLSYLYCDTALYFC